MMQNNKDNYPAHIRNFLENMWRFVTPKNKSVVFKFLTDVKNGHLLGANRQFTEGAEIGLYEMSQNNNKAMLFKAVGRDIENGGIDLKLENFEIHSTDAGIEFDFDPAMMQNIRFDGLVPVINGIEKSMNLRLILGLETGTPESNPDQNMSQELVAIKS